MEIGGEHEDHYDSDFCIYNDVVVHKPDGTFDVFGYPRDVFPPTDSHASVYFDHKIYIIGCLGYPESRQPGRTPIYVLDCDSWSISRAEPTGECPGWIFKHRASLEPGGIIRISGGETCGETAFNQNTTDWLLDVGEMKFRAVEAAQ